MKSAAKGAAAKKAAAAKIAREVAAMFAPRSPKRWMWVEKWGRDGYAYGA